MNRDRKDDIKRKLKKISEKECNDNFFFQKAVNNSKVFKKYELSSFAFCININQ